MNAPLVAASMSATVLGVAVALTASRSGRHGSYLAGKAAASVGFVTVALLVGATAASWSRLALAALTLSAAGDVALASRARRGFALGLALFMAAHLAFSVAFVLHGTHLGWAAVAAGLAATGAIATWRAFGAGVPRRLRGPVAVYLGVLVALVASGVGSGVANGQPLLALGAVLVAGSDLAVARQRFVAPAFANKLAGLPAYYLGQLLVALSLASG